MNKETGGPAFPHSFVAHPTEETFVAKGMTLRDVFAAKAMQGYLASVEGQEFNASMGAEFAYKVADAMLKARKT